MLLLLAASAGFVLTHSMHQDDLEVWLQTLIMQLCRLQLPGRHQQLALSTSSWLNCGRKTTQATLALAARPGQATSFCVIGGAQATDENCRACSQARLK